MLPPQFRGTRSNELFHICDWYATLAALVGMNPEDRRAELLGLPAIDSLDLKGLLGFTQAIDQPTTATSATADPAEGDHLLLSADESEVRFAMAETGYSWNALMRGQLGKVFTAQPTPPLHAANGVVALPSLRGLNGGTWYVLLVASGVNVQLDMRKQCTATWPLPLCPRPVQVLSPVSADGAGNQVAADGGPDDLNGSRSRWRRRAYGGAVWVH